MKIAGMKRRAARLLTIVFLVLFLVSCESLGEIGSLGAGIAASSGLINENQAEAVSSAAESLEKAFETLTPEQEYYLGRSIVANLFEIYPPLDSPAATKYVNTLGQSLAIASDRPSTFSGYHFIILDSDDINAFATPGGFVLVTTGMLECTTTEGMLAAVLAHEIAHIQLDHGIKSIKSSRWTDAITKTALAGASMSSAEIAEVTEAFGGSISDVTNTLVVSGYSRGQEEEADAVAADLLARVGYNPNDLIAMLEEMDERIDPSGRDFAATHPKPQDRISNVKGTIRKLDLPNIDNTDARDRRYGTAMISF